MNHELKTGIRAGQASESSVRRRQDAGRLVVDLGRLPVTMPSQGAADEGGGLSFLLPSSSRRSCNLFIAIVFTALISGTPLTLHAGTKGKHDQRILPQDTRVAEDNNPVAEHVPDPAISVVLTARRTCNKNNDRKFTHRVRARWQMPDVQTGIKRVYLRALLSSGKILEKNDAGLKGSVMFKINEPLGSQVIVTANAETEQGDATTNNTLLLQPCVHMPRPEHGAGFVAPPTEDPEPPIAIPGSPIKESHFAHLGGTGNPNKILMVSAVGTGAVVKLSSWTLGRDSSDVGAPLKPILLKDLDQNLVGYNAKLHTLSPETSPKLLAAPFVNGIIRDGVLWLTTWQLDDAGDFLKAKTNGYGGAISRTERVAVSEYAMTHRSISIGGTDYFELITPIITEDNKIRVISWAIRKNDGAIFGLKDSGNLVAKPASDSLVDISRIKNGNGVDYVAVYRNQDNVMTSILLEVFNGNSLGASGFVFDRGNAASGLNLRGSNTVAETVEQAIVMPLNKGGYMTSTVNGFDTLTSVWDYHMPGFDPVLVPYRIADETLDQDAGFGVDVGPVPDLTDGSSANVQNGATQKVRARLTDDLWEETFGVGAGEVASEFPVGEFTSVGIASVTKVMTLLLAVEAIDNGDVNLNDIVEVSANAAGTGGSSMNLQEGEKQSLQNLMYGMMMVSGNDASVAIAEHVADKVIGGDESDFVNLMNIKAGALGLSNTSYNQPAGGGYSTPQDQITLFRFGAKNPLFRDFAEKKVYTACGELKNGNPVCRNVDKFADNGYPGLEGWKNGNLGFIDANLQNVPLCTSCLLAQARRADRAMLVGLQQSGARWTDTGNLWDYGFTKLFTPDKRASSSSIGSPAKDLAVDVISDNYAVTAVITNLNDLRLCLWNIWVDTGSLDNSPNECTTHPDFNMVGNPAITVIPNRVDGARISTLLVEGDYITVTQNNSFSVRLWRVGPKEP